jgi:hypothetical protein
MMWVLLCWSLLLWCLLSVPLSVLFGRCIAAAERRPGAAPVLARVPQGAALGRTPASRRG